MLIKIRPPKNHIDSIKDVHPEIVLLLKYENKTYPATMISNNIKINPMPKIILIGLAENDVIPSTEKLIIFLKEYLELPATRSSR